LSAVLCLAAAGCGGPPAPLPESATKRPAEQNAAASADKRAVIVAFGDSLTAGYGVPRDAAYPAVLQQLLDKRGLRYRVVNAGLSGDTTAGGLARVDTVIGYRPRIVVLELGANDGLRGLPVEASRDNLEQMIVRLKEAGARVVLAGMTLPPNYGPDYVRSFEQVFVDLAKKHGTPRIPFFLEDVATRPERMLSDTLHPNAAGHRVVAERVWRLVEPLLAAE